MKYAAHYIIDHDGKMYKGGVLELRCKKLHQVIEMGEQIRELQQMVFHSGVIIPQIPNLKSILLANAKQAKPSLYAEHINIAIELNIIDEFEWMKAIWTKKTNITLPRLVSLLCNEIPKTLGIQESKIQINNICQLGLVTGVDYKEMNLQTHSRYKKLN